jgi:hypothetical protein
MEKTFVFTQKHLEILNHVSSLLSDAKDYIDSQCEYNDDMIMIGRYNGRAHAKVDYAEDLILSLITETAEIILKEEDEQ